MRPLIHPVPPKYGGTGTLSERAGESSGTRVRFVDPGPSDLYGNITTFGETRLLEAWREWALNAYITSISQALKHLNPPWNLVSSNLLCYHTRDRVEQNLTRAPAESPGPPGSVLQIDGTNFILIFTSILYHVLKHPVPPKCLYLRDQRDRVEHNLTREPADLPCPSKRDP